MSIVSVDSAEFEPPESADAADADEFSEGFFATDSLAPVESEWEPDPIPSMAVGSRRAMHATLGLLGLSVLGIGGFLFYARVLMPTPVALGAAVAQPPGAYNMPMEARLEAIAPAVPVPVAEPVPAAVAETVIEPSPVEPAEIAAAEPAEVAPAVAPKAPAKRVKPAKKARPAQRRRASGGLASRAHASLNRGDFRAAAKFAERAVMQRPERSGNWIVLAAARDALGDDRGAKRAYRMCTEQAMDSGVAACRALRR